MVDVTGPAGLAPKLQDLVAQSRGANARDLLARFMTPVALIALPIDARVAAPDESAEERLLPFETMQGSLQQVMAAADLAPFRDAFVAPIAKSTRNSFAQMITVGRATNNDIVIPLATLSKMHGYFMLAPQRPPRWYDAGSKNGTYVGPPGAERRLEARVPHELEDGEELKLGQKIRLLHRTPAGLIEMIRAFGGR